MDSHAKLIAVTTDIESRELKRITNMEEGLPPEHLRASSTDDVECFFSILRDSVGKHFTVKQVQFAYRKLCIEFIKRFIQIYRTTTLRPHMIDFMKDHYQALTSQGLGRNVPIIPDTRESLAEIRL